MFFSFDGIDGVGKTTQMELFCRWLREQQREVVACRDPGGTRLGEAVREILLTSDGAPIGLVAEMFLYMAARAQLVAEVIQPALAAGKTVVCDRFLLANVVYQGHAGGLDPAMVWDVGRVAVDGVSPQMTFVLDMQPQDARRRIQREPDRMERQSDDYRARLRAGFLAEAQRHPDRIQIIDAARPIDDVAAAIRTAAEPLIGRRST